MDVGDNMQPMVPSRLYEQHTHTHTHTKTNKQTNKQTNKKQTNTQTNKQTNKQTNRRAYPHRLPRGGAGWSAGPPRTREQALKHKDNAPLTTLMSLTGHVCNCIPDEPGYTTDCLFEAGGVAGGSSPGLLFFKKVPPIDGVSRARSG